MRTSVGVALVIVCLGLAGCSLFGKKRAAPKGGSNPKPFLGAEAPAKSERAAVPLSSSDGPLPGANGYLAGRVVALSTGDPIKARIEIRDLEEEEDSKAAPLDVETVEGGWFTIPGLKPGRHYKLIARGKEGSELVSQVVFAQPPKSTLFLQLSKHNTTASTPPIPEPSKPPTKKGASGTGSSHEHIPATTLDPPVKVDPSKEPPPPDNSLGAVGGNSGNISNIAEGFPRVPPAPTVEVPNKSEHFDPQPQQSTPMPTPPAPTPQWESMTDPRQTRNTPPAASPSQSVQIPSMPTRVPSCGLYGNRLDNFALNDIDGQPWEFKRDFHGRLLLLDFWYHTCYPCLKAIPRLTKLQSEYGPWGLQVVGIACETGPLEKQRENVRSIRGRYNINYTTLLSGGGPGRCPVMNQFHADYFPMLVLIDKSGRVIWRSTNKGMDDYAHQRLRALIHQQLIQN